MKVKCEKDKLSKYNQKTSYICDETRLNFKRSLQRCVKFVLLLSEILEEKKDLTNFIFLKCLIIYLY